MPSLLSTDEIREHVETDLSDEALQLRIDEAEADIVRLFGANTGAVSERFTPGPGELYLFTSRPIDTGETITIVETWDGPAGETDVTLAASDYEVEGSTQIRRKQGGMWSSGSWAVMVSVMYTPIGTNARRKGVLVDLVKLAVAYQGVQSSTLGDVAVGHVDYARERNGILRRLVSVSGMFA